LNKIERVSRALRGEDVDRPPFSFWYHFGLQHMPGRKHAEAEIDFFRTYDLDFLKVMNDYPYPLPSDIAEVESESDWKSIEPVDPKDPCWREQLAALEIINEAIGGEALFIETIFSPWTTARRLTPSGSLAEARKCYPDLLLSALGSIADSLAGYAGEAIARGASGIFLSLGAATNEVMSPEEYELWGRPFDLRVLEAAKCASFNVLHIHGRNIHFDSLLDYPVTALNWSHFATDPTLKEGREKAGRAVLGGINEATAAQLSAPEIRKQVLQSLSETGTRGVIVTPGCSVPSDTPKSSLRAIKDALE
jgi:uroporphyrinogen decarboxylase